MYLQVEVHIESSEHQACKAKQYSFDEKLNGQNRFAGSGAAADQRRPSLGKAAAGYFIKSCYTGRCFGKDMIVLFHYYAGIS